MYAIPNAQKNGVSIANITPKEPAKISILLIALKIKAIIIKIGIRFI